MRQPDLVLELPADVAFTRLATTAAETLAQRAGLARRENLRLQLAVEECFACLAGTMADAAPLRLELTAARHQLRAAFAFAAPDLSLGGLNAVPLTTHAPDAESLGLLLAGKAADRFRVESQGDRRFLLALEVDRAYASASPVTAPATWRAPYVVRPCLEEARLVQAATLARQQYAAWHCPPAFHTPAKVADMAAEGEMHCLLALDAAQQPAGLLCWSPRNDSHKAVTFAGPFVFTTADREHVARLLCEGLLQALARDRWEIVWSLAATPCTPPGFFESLGTLSLCQESVGQNALEGIAPGQKGACIVQDVRYRHLGEDAGMAVWSHPRLESFLTRTYDELAMSRELLPLSAAPAQSRSQSLLAATVDYPGNLGELRPLLDGQDMARNLAAHVQALYEKNIGNIFAYMDLSDSWQAGLADALLQTGFAPQLVLPYGGRGDVVVWQHVRTA